MQKSQKKKTTTKIKIIIYYTDRAPGYTFSEKQFLRQKPVYSILPFVI